MFFKRHNNLLLHLRILANKKGRKGNIILFHSARCGSTVIGDLMKKHPGVAWGGEVFNPNVFGYIEPDWTRDPVRKTILWHLHRRRCSYFGFETTIMPSQQLGSDIIPLSLQEYLDVLLEAGVTHFVILKRKNYLKRSISAAVAITSNKFHTRQTTDRPYRIKLDTEDFTIGSETMPLLVHFEQMDRRYEELGLALEPHRTLHLIYEEDIMEDPLAGYGRMCDFLGIEKIPVRTDYKKTNPFALKDILENFDEVAELLSGTKYEWMLKE